jgi:hypothetical protein
MVWQRCVSTDGLGVSSTLRVQGRGRDEAMDIRVRHCAAKTPFLSALVTGKNGVILAF